MKKTIMLGLGVILMSLSGCMTTVDGYSRPKPKEDSIRAKSYFDLGVAYMSKKRYDLAEPRLRRSINILPTAEAYNALAVLYEEQRENALAEEAYKTLISQFPDYLLGYMNYNIFLCKYDRQAQIQALSATMMSKGNEMAALGQIAAGNCALEKGNANRAKQYYKKALQYEPHSAGALLPLAEINHQRGFASEAKQYLDLLHNHIGESARSVYLGVLINRELGNRLEERNFMRALRTRFANSQEAKALSGN